MTMTEKEWQTESRSPAKMLNALVAGGNRPEYAGKARLLLVKCAQRMIDAAGGDDKKRAAIAAAEDFAAVEASATGKITADTLAAAHEAVLTNRPNMHACPEHQELFSLAVLASAREVDLNDGRIIGLLSDIHQRLTMDVCDIIRNTFAPPLEVNNLNVTGNAAGHNRTQPALPAGG